MSGGMEAICNYLATCPLTCRETLAFRARQANGTRQELQEEELKLDSEHEIKTQVSPYE